MADVLRSAALKDAGFAHAFSLRAGGVSDAPFGTLNLGRGVGDDEECVWENHIRFAARVPYGRDELFEVSQVHGVSVRLIAPGEDPLAVRREEHDALIAPSGGIAVGVRTADCVPILLADTDSGAVAAVHAGWRGAVNQILPRTIDRMRAEFGTATSALVAAVGPHIRVANFEVGEEVADAALAAVRATGTAALVDVVVRGAQGAKPHVDLAALVAHQLRAAGVTRVDDVGGCTFVDGARFFSYRRDAGRTGRHLAAIVSRR
jgi:hypothetical protein